MDGPGYTPAEADEALRTVEHVRGRMRKWARWGAALQILMGLLAIAFFVITTLTESTLLPALWGVAAFGLALASIALTRRVRMGELADNNPLNVAFVVLFVLAVAIAQAGSDDAGWPAFLGLPAAATAFAGAWRLLRR